MRTRTVTVSEGEHLGPVDWDEAKWSFKLEHPLFDQRTMLRKLEADPGRYEVTDDGGWPRVGWHRVYWVGMYDGWPYWRPGPCVCVAGTLGPEHYWANSITEIRELPPAQRMPREG